MKSVSQVFIDHPRAAWVVSILIALCGGICLSRMPVSESYWLLGTKASMGSSWTPSSSAAMYQPYTSRRRDLSSLPV